LNKVEIRWLQFRGTTGGFRVAAPAIWVLKAGTALSLGDRYPIKSDNGFTSVTQVLERIRTRRMGKD